MVFGCAGARHGQRRDPRPLRQRASRRSGGSKPLLDNEITSAYSMTEPQAGADPKVLRTSAYLDGDEWVINGEKWFTSNAKWSDVPDRVRRHRARQPAVPAGVDVHRADRHARASRSSATSGWRTSRVGDGHRGLHAQDRRPRAEREPARRRAAGVRRGPDPPRRRAHPPRHAHRRRGAAGVRHDVRAGHLARRRRARCSPTSR